MGRREYDGKALAEMMKTETKLALWGIGLMALGAAMTYFSARRYSERRLVADAGSCRMELTAVERANLPRSDAGGTVVLFHGLSANKKIMEYWARAFAEMGLRVYVPDLPGHGRTEGPFSAARAEACAASLVRGLAARGMLQPDRTILAGHSMGAAIALRLAPKFRPAGVIAVSPAPMKAAHGVSPETLLYSGPPVLGANTLIMAGQYEPKGLSGNAADLAATRNDGTVEYLPIPGNSHVSVLFSPMVARFAQAWAAKVLQLPEPRSLPLRGNLLGGVLGLIGIALLAGPFLVECLGKTPAAEKPWSGIASPAQFALEFAVVSLAVVLALRYWVPLRVLHIFEGDYLASFFLIAGLLLVTWHAKAAAGQFRPEKWTLLGAVLGGLVLHLLITGWLQLTVMEAWLTTERWTRFPLFFLGAFLFLYAMEVVLGPAQIGQLRARYAFAALLVVLTWLTLATGVLFLHSGEILLVLMSPYFAVFFLTMGLGAQLVRRMSGSATATAVFGAILLTGFCLMLFPVS